MFLNIFNSTTYNITTMTGTELNKYFDDAINQIKDAKSHWIINPSMSLIELRIAKSELEKIIKLIKE